MSHLWRHLWATLQSKLCTMVSNKDDGPPDASTGACSVSVMSKKVKGSQDVGMRWHKKLSCIIFLA